MVLIVSSIRRQKTEYNRDWTTDGSTSGSQPLTQWQVTAVRVTLGKYLPSLRLDWTVGINPYLWQKTWKRKSALNTAIDLQLLCVCVFVRAHPSWSTAPPGCSVTVMMTAALRCEIFPVIECSLLHFSNFHNVLFLFIYFFFYLFHIFCIHVFLFTSELESELLYWSWRGHFINYKKKKKKKNPKCPNM